MFLRKKSNKPIRTIKQQWVSCFGILYLSFGIALVVLFIVQIPLGLIIGKTNTLLSNSLYFIAAPITQFVVSYRDGQSNYQFRLGRLLLALLLTLATQVALVLIIGGHAIYFSGPAIVFDEYLLRIYNPIEVPTRTVLDTYEWALMFASDLFVYVPTILLGEYLGNKKRIKEFNEAEEPEPVNEAE